MPQRRHNKATFRVKLAIYADWSADSITNHPEWREINERDLKFQVNGP